MNKIAKVTSKGQITVPREIRLLLGIDSGEYLEFIRKGDDIIISKKEEAQTPKLVDIRYSTRMLNFNREEANER